MPDQTVSEVLRKAADLLEKPGAWTQGSYARDATGGFTLVSNDDAACYCISGALCVVGDGAGGSAWAFLNKFLRQNPSRWNDASGRTQAEVVQALRTAANTAEGA